ncbi:hypothetical protein TIFTF001_040810 [Ficus carica]|uniref:Uncharacterized protein n=1 Tax=Ficus carica TaxID=3494 RepID=A0AA87Z0J2_FICCA|nr:hypothetical protein TIFTF001_040810 [Ficus carica]
MAMAFPFQVAEASKYVELNEFRNGWWHSSHGFKGGCGWGTISRADLRLGEVSNGCSWGSDSGH